MLGTVMNMMNNALQPLVTQYVQPLSRPAKTENPFAVSSPLMTFQGRRNGFYGKNEPVQGGYFAGYYNGQANIVGRKLFINA